jgi:hypothetical protein
MISKTKIIHRSSDHYYVYLDSVQIHELLDSTFGRDNLIPEISKVIDDSFSTGKSNTSRKKLVSLLKSLDSMILAKDTKTNSIEGYVFNKNSTTQNILHYSGLSVLQSTQGKGVAKKLLLLAWYRHPSKLISFSTQNPIIYSLFSNAGFKLFPSPKLKTPKYMKDLIRVIFESKGYKINKSFVVKNRYNKCLYKRIPSTFDNKINFWFAKILSIPKSGKTKNALYILGKPNPAKMDQVF